MSDPARPSKPGPTPNPESAPFWDGLAEGVVRVQQCDACGRRQHYARSVCSQCWSEDLTWVEVAGTGRVHTWTVVHRAGHPAWAGDTPYAVLVVELDAGPRLVTAHEGDLDALAVGMPVRLLARPRGETHVVVAVTTTEKEPS
ncbi:Zn-ribbon domain-containing OB-fold protein [Phycicoccus sp. BSK3Z-2]|uniref:Zn-ribbon domain-containing OB-fold protein n=1 Tax=Phycicoccus avicenniae TaxID=2828860 RepID=A0A941I048_9MICO|nr:Zn-ribbon domain-containing OB-fold protein [Phycicoccus avicenniae]MBR7744818.1 Zn-ribbon domain-containing OB-fold protein [Phycicoccus avicenniae]